MAPRRLLAALSALPLAACMGCVDEVTDHDLQSEDGRYLFVLEPDPDPPSTGAAALRLALTSLLDEAPLTGAHVQITPWMPDMGHGIQDPPVVVEEGAGIYHATWRYSMPGYWTLTIDVEGEAGTDQLIVGYDVQ